MSGSEQGQGEQAGAGHPGELVCVEYPGVVTAQDPGPMLHTLGGLDTIAQVLEEPNRRLELRFRPDDVFSKPTCGERQPDTSFLIRVKRRKLRPGVVPSEDKPAEKCDVEVEGIVSDCYKFNNLCDFQYLPMVYNSQDNSHTDIYSRVYPGNEKLVDSSWLDQDAAAAAAPLFIPPAAFSRMDLPQDYQFRRETAGPATPANIIGRTRQRRSHHAIFVTYHVERVPDKPRDVALNQIKLKFIDQERLATVKERFLERPVWSKNALSAITSIPADRLKLILPVVAFYFTTGPWRNQWVKFGYDPRREAGAGPHQTLDYRVRLQGGARNIVTAKRSYANYLLPYKAMNWSKPKTSLINTESFITSQDDKKLEEVTEEEKEKLLDVYLFREGRIPPYRQMFYQYGDLQLQEAQDILARSRGAECLEKSGWYLAGTEDRLRESLTRSINQHLRPDKSGDSQSD